MELIKPLWELSARREAAVYLPYERESKHLVSLFWQKKKEEKDGITTSSDVIAAPKADPATCCYISTKCG